MMRLKPWQVAVLVAPIAVIVTFLLIAAGQQIRSWHLNWIWAVFIFMLLGWRWLVVRWTRPAIAQAEAIVSEMNAELEEANAEAAASLARSADQVSETPAGDRPIAKIEAALADILQTAKDDPPVWEDWQLFWQHCLALVTVIARTYYPEVKRPLLSIYVPEAYGLIRGTVDDTDRMMQKLSPVLGQVSIGQMVEGVELYRRLEPSARKLVKAFNWAQWALNPAAAIARQVSAKNMSQANQQIVFNLSTMLRETLLRNLAQQAIALYGGEASDKLETVLAQAPAVLPQAKTETLREILEKAEPAEAVEQKPVNILLVGRTGAGKSSAINTLFQSERAAVDVLPSTDRIQSYRWSAKNIAIPSSAVPKSAVPSSVEESLTLWDTPGYEQVARDDLRQQVIDYANEADVLLLVTPALDPALQMDADFLAEVQAEVADLPAIAIVTQVDRLRPVREWSPPYHWQSGSWPKEKSIREAVSYRAEKLAEYCQQVLPLVTMDSAKGREAWGDEALSLALIEAIAPAKQLRLARFLRSQDARSQAAAKIIDRITFQMSTTEGLARLLKSPVLQFIATMTTGTPALGALLIEKIPVEEGPVVLGKLQMAYELFSLLAAGNAGARNFDLLALWPLLIKSSDQHAASRRAWAFGHALTEYWTQNIPIAKLEERIEFYLNQA
ncbi:50S ribosome-binding GTPase [cf. Phormidesmis sp. LEGE 11477]|nr:50S ribosome-binding GTPase [cf. Phormidesmis sp. LEGE 11477]